MSHVHTAICAEIEEAEVTRFPDPDIPILIMWLDLSDFGRFMNLTQALVKVYEHRLRQGYDLRLTTRKHKHIWAIFEEDYPIFLIKEIRI